MSNIVYILTNPYMPGLIKIGKTDNLEQRIKDLSSHPGVPVAFECFHACEVREDKGEVEKRLHARLENYRINKKREFFEFSPERARDLLMLAQERDVTPERDLVENVEEQEALNKARKKAAKFNFSMVGIEKGTELSFVEDENKKATVMDYKTIEYNDKSGSLSGIALDLLRETGRKLVSVRGPDYWEYEGETLAARRSRMESEGS